MVIKYVAFFIFLFFCAFSGHGQEKINVEVESKHPYSSDKPLSEPTVFAPGIISTGDYEFAADFSPDGKSIYFVKSTPDFSFWTMVSSQFENNKWSEPQVMPFSGKYTDGDQFVTSDGKRIFFISARPLSINASPAAPIRLRIWVTDRTENGWSEPVNLGEPVNGDGSQYFPTLTKDGTLYFGSNRKGGNGGVDLYRSKFANGKFLEPENLGDTINTKFDEYEPLIAPDERFLIFMANGRPDGLGGYDLFISYNENGKWTKPENLGAPINSPADDFSPKISPDGKYFFWTSNRRVIGLGKTTYRNYREMINDYRNLQNGLGDIYYIDKSVLKIKR